MRSYLHLLRVVYGYTVRAIPRYGGFHGSRDLRGNHARGHKSSVGKRGDGVPRRENRSARFPCGTQGPSSTSSGAPFRGATQERWGEGSALFWTPSPVRVSNGGEGKHQKRTRKGHGRCIFPFVVDERNGQGEIELSRVVCGCTVRAGCIELSRVIHCSRSRRCQAWKRNAAKKQNTRGRIYFSQLPAVSRCDFFDFYFYFSFRLGISVTRIVILVTRIGNLVTSAVISIFIAPKMLGIYDPS